MVLTPRLFAGHVGGVGEVCLHPVLKLWVIAVLMRFPVAPMRSSTWVQWASKTDRFSRRLSPAHVPHGVYIIDHNRHALPRPRGAVAEFSDRFSAAGQAEHGGATSPM